MEHIYLYLADYTLDLLFVSISAEPFNLFKFVTLFL